MTRWYVVTGGDWFEIEQINKSIHVDSCDTFYDIIRAESRSEAKRKFFYQSFGECKYIDIKVRLLSNKRLTL